MFCIKKLRQTHNKYYRLYVQHINKESGHNLAAVKAFAVNYKNSGKFQLTDSFPAGWWAKMCYSRCSCAIKS